MKNIIYLASSALVIAFAMNAPASAERGSAEGGGGGNYKVSPRMSDGGRMAARVDRDGRGPRIDGRIEGRIDGRINKRVDERVVRRDWEGDRKHRHHFRDRHRIVRFGVPLYYDDYYLSYYDDRCSKYYRRYMRTGNPYWLDKYEDCID